MPVSLNLQVSVERLLVLLRNQIRSHRVCSADLLGPDGMYLDHVEVPTADGFLDGSDVPSAAGFVRRSPEAEPTSISVLSADSGH